MSIPWYYIVILKILFGLSVYISDQFYFSVDDRLPSISFIYISSSFFGVIDDGHSLIAAVNVCSPCVNSSDDGFQLYLLSSQMFHFFMSLMKDIH